MKRLNLEPFRVLPAQRAWQMSLARIGAVAVWNTARICWQAGRDGRVSGCRGVEWASDLPDTPHAHPRQAQRDQDLPGYDHSSYSHQLKATIDKNYRATL